MERDISWPSGGMADAGDLKSLAGNGVRVRVPPWLSFFGERERGRCLFFFLAPACIVMQTLENQRLVIGQPSGCFQDSASRLRRPRCDRLIFAARPDLEEISETCRVNVFTRAISSLTCPIGMYILKHHPGVRIPVPIQPNRQVRCTTSQTS